MIKFHKDGSKPSQHQIFVFGSNLSGIHGAGAAAYALQLGAEWGEFDGMTGGCYAIPTKDGNIQTMRLSEIRKYIDKFVVFTQKNPDLEFFVTRVGCGLAGFKDRQIAPLFRGAENCSFAEEWRPFL